MRLGITFLALAAALLLGGCSLRKPKTANAAPPPPRPAVAPATPPAPLSTPQTTVELPPPQPVPPDALPPAETSAPAPAPAPARTTTRPQRATPAGPRPEPAQPAPVTAPPPAQSAEPPRAPLTEVLPAPELKRLQDEADGRMQETRQLIGQIPQRRLNQLRNTVARIQSFLNQAEEAKRRGDMRQASELAGRALVLARELKP